MASSDKSDFIEVFHEKADKTGWLAFDAFMDLALYHPVLGYYCRHLRRVGQDRQSDFFTASSLGPVFGSWVLEAARRLLLSAKRDPGEHLFFDWGAEEGQDPFAGLPHPFLGLKRLSLGEEPVLQGPCVCFSNELFDAQPCRRFVRREGQWLESGVRFSTSLGRFVEDSGPALEAEWLPATAPEAYRFDAPRAAVYLLEKVARQPWIGLFLAFDYGKPFPLLAEECPSGTLRAYRRHQQGGDLFEAPGFQDLTCHICWDWMEAKLRQHGFRSLCLLSQEAFFVTWAGEALATEIRAGARKQTVLQLLHPSHMGQKFQVLSALR